MFLLENLTNLDLENVDEKQVEYQRALKKYASAQSLKVVTVTANKDNQRFINLVPEKASADIPVVLQMQHTSKICQLINCLFCQAEKCTGLLKSQEILCFL